MAIIERVVTPAVLVLLPASCSSSSSGGRLPEPIVDNCDSTSYLVDGTCVVFAERLDERATTPFFEDGSDPSLFSRTVIIKSVSRYFVERGWMVAYPQRRGRGRSDGTYDEGFAPDRSGYSCNHDIALAGVSRRGILSVAHVARRPDVYRGAINFVGGWIAEGCGDFADINRTLFIQGAAWPGVSSWLYAENDSFYSIRHSRDNFDAFTAAGGIGEFHLFRRASGLNGHFLVNDLELWESSIDAYLATR